MRRLALIMLAVVAGCGSEDEPERTQPPAPPTYETIAITEPDEPVPADTATGGRFSVETTVRGTSEPFSEVLVSADCTLAACEAVARSDGQGRWDTELALEAPRSSPQVRVRARYADANVRGEPGETMVELARPTGGGSGGSEAPADDEEPGRTPRSLVMVGDSLAVGTRDLLPDLLPGWNVQTQAQEGATLRQGMTAFDGIQPTGPTVAAFSLFTNNKPGEVDDLERAVRRSVRRVRETGGCAVWATISRPPHEGRGYGAINTRLRALETELGRRMIVVPWAETVADRPELLRPDRVHGTPEGYEVRAELYAEAAESCRG